MRKRAESFSSVWAIMKSEERIVFGIEGLETGKQTESVEKTGETFHPAQPVVYEEGQRKDQTSQRPKANITIQIQKPSFDPVVEIVPSTPSFKEEADWEQTMKRLPQNNSEDIFEETIKNQEGLLFSMMTEDDNECKTPQKALEIISEADSELNSPLCHKSSQQKENSSILSLTPIAVDSITECDSERTEEKKADKIDLKKIFEQIHASSLAKKVAKKLFIDTENELNRSKVHSVFVQEGEFDSKSDTGGISEEEMSIYEKMNDKQNTSAFKNALMEEENSTGSFESLKKENRFHQTNSEEELELVYQLSGRVNNTFFKEEQEEQFDQEVDEEDFSRMINLLGGQKTKNSRSQHLPEGGLPGSLQSSLEEIPEVDSFCWGLNSRMQTMTKEKIDIYTTPKKNLMTIVETYEPESPLVGNRYAFQSNSLYSHLASPISIQFDQKSNTEEEPLDNDAVNLSSENAEQPLFNWEGMIDSSPPSPFSKPVMREHSPVQERKSNLQENSVEEQQGENQASEEMYKNLLENKSTPFSSLFQEESNEEEDLNAVYGNTFTGGTHRDHTSEEVYTGCLKSKAELFLSLLEEEPGGEEHENAVYGNAFTGGIHRDHTSEEVYTGCLKSKAELFLSLLEEEPGGEEHENAVYGNAFTGAMTEDTAPVDQKTSEEMYKNLLENKSTPFSSLFQEESNEEEDLNAVYGNAFTGGTHRDQTSEEVYTGCLKSKAELFLSLLEEEPGGEDHENAVYGNAFTSAMTEDTAPVDQQEAEKPLSTRKEYLSIARFNSLDTIKEEESFSLEQETYTKANMDVSMHSQHPLEIIPETTGERGSLTFVFSNDEMEQEQYTNAREITTQTDRFSELETDDEERDNRQGKRLVEYDKSDGERNSLLMYDTVFQEIDSNKSSESTIIKLLKQAINVENEEESQRPVSPVRLRPSIYQENRTTKRAMKEMLYGQKRTPLSFLFSTLNRV